MYQVVPWREEQDLRKQLNKFCFVELLPPGDQIVFAPFVDKDCLQTTAHGLI